MGGQYNGQGTILQISVYGDDPSTEIKDGFFVGEPFRYEIELSNGEVIYNDSISAEYATTGIFVDSGTFVTNGLSGLVSLVASRY